jgi:hypothetical protein
MTRTRTKIMTGAAFLDSLGPGEPLEALQARHQEDVALAMARKDQPLKGAIPIRIRPGRPPKGEEAPIQPKVIKMPPAFWEQMQRSAQASGLTLHAAMRQALAEWTRNHKAS